MGEKLTTPLTEQLTALVKHAKITSEAEVRTPENAESTIASGEADLVSFVRGQIADPHLAHKVPEGQAGDVRGCIACNQLCWGRRSRDCWISCLIDPSAERQFEWGRDRFTKAGQPRLVLVVDAGPMGLAAVWASAERGHRVDVHEAGHMVGGQFRVAGMQPRRGLIIDLMGWYEQQLAQPGVALHLDSYLDRAGITAHSADHVIIATGCLPDETEFRRWVPHEETLRSIDLGHVWSPEAVLRREARLRIALIVDDQGSNGRGVGLAWALAEQGKRVLVVTPEAFVGRKIACAAADGPAWRRIAQLGVQMRC